MLSPLLLGVAAVILRQQHRLGGPAASAKAATIVVACAIVPCLLPSDSLTVEASYSWLAFSPLRGVLVVCPAVLAWAWWVNGRGVLGAGLTVLPWLLAALGHTPSAMLKHARWLIDGVSTLLPRTQLQWGALAIAAAFICLIFGGLISWRRVSHDKAGTPQTPDG